MKFRLFLLFTFFFCSLFYGQTKLFVKFKNNFTSPKMEEHLTKALQEASLKKSASSNSNKLKQYSFSEKFGSLNSELDKTVSVLIPKGIDIRKYIETLKKNNNIQSVTKVITYQIDSIPTDSLYKEQWGLQSINAPEAWNLLPQNPKEIILAVIDTGIDYEHPDLKNVIYINKGEAGNEKSSNGIDDDDNGFVDDFRGWDFVNKLDIFPADLQNDFTDWDNNPFDENGHGTQISGIIGAEHNSIGIAGVNPNVKILNIRGFDKNGSGEEDDIASAIIYAVKMGAKIINMSFGDAIYSEVLKDVIEYAYSQGIVLIGSSGNSASDLPHYPSGYNEVISVGAIQENNVLSSFSNFGSTIDLVAPGSLIFTTSLDNTYKKVNGTSASTPFVSGSAAILLSIKNDISNEEVKQILKSTAIDLGEEGWDIKYGAGRLDLLKAIQLLVPSEIKINSPVQDYFVTSNTLSLNISVLSPLFKKFTLSYGVGFNPTDWKILNTNFEEEQLLKEDVYSLNVEGFQDTVYTIRLLVNFINGKTTEERTNFYIDKTKPEILLATIFPALLNNDETFQASILTDDLTDAKLFFRQKNTNQEYDFIYLDGTSGFVPTSKTISKSHFGFLPLQKVENNIEYEFYFEVTNRAGLKTIHKAEDGNDFVLQTLISKNIKPLTKKKYSLPIGRIFNTTIKFGNLNEKFILLNENKTSADLSIFRKNQNSLTKVDSIQKRIPVAVGDFNNDGKTDILSLFVKGGFIETQTKVNEIKFTNVFTDSSGTFWPAYADDIDGDNKTEIIVFSSDTTITIWEVQSDFNLIEEKVLVNFIPKKINSIFRSNKILIDDFNNDNINEILTTDNFGRIITYNITGANTYENGFIIEHFFPFEAKSNIARGDFNADGITDISIFLDFENDEYLTPLNYCSVVSLNDNKVNTLFQSMFIDAANDFSSVFQKKYKSIELANLDNDNSDELIVFNFPNSYVFKFIDSNKTQLLSYKTNVNTQAIFVGDLDNDNKSEIGIPNSEILFFYEFNSDKIASPIIKESYSKDLTHVYLQWEENLNPVRIFSGSSSDNLVVVDSTSNNTYIDEVLPTDTLYYSLAYYNSLNGELLSELTETISVYLHASAKLNSIKVLNPKNIELVFSEKINTKQLQLQNFRLDSLVLPNSIRASSEKSIHLTFRGELSLGLHNLVINDLRDFYTTPIKKQSIKFEVKQSINELEELFIKSYEIINNHSIIISFNFNLDTLTALTKSNYSFAPNNIINSLSFYKNSKNSIVLQATKPFGSIGKEYNLSINNLFSSKETGNIALRKNAGSEIILVSTANNLDDVYVYPNPMNVGEHSKITFANLTNFAEIYIFSLTGAFVIKLIEEDANGGVSWNMKDINNIIVGSGVYVYKIIDLDSQGNSKQEVMGKFVVVR